MIIRKIGEKGSIAAGVGAVAAAVSNAICRALELGPEVEAPLTGAIIGLTMAVINYLKHRKD